MATARETDIKISFEINNKPLDIVNDKIDKIVSRVSSGMTKSEEKINKVTETFTKMSNATKNAEGKITQATSMFNKWGQATTKVTNKIAVMDAKTTTAMNSINTRAQQVKTAMDKIGSSVQKVGNKIATPFVKGFDKIKTKITDTTKNVTFFTNSIKKAITNSNSLSKVRTSFDKIRTAITNVHNPLGRLPTLFQRVRSTAQQTGTTGKTGMTNLTSSIFKANAALDILKAGFQKIIDSIGTMIHTTDQWISTTARLNLINDGTQTTPELRDKLLGASQRSHGSYTAMADTTSKLGLLAGENFTGNDELIKFSELMQKSFAVSGASGSEQSAGMYQLTQAMAAGKLQGDEFRSIMENAPMLAQAIADYTGKSKGELKEMSSDGLITADIIKKALFKAGDDINEKFASMPTTFEGAWTMIKNEALFSFQKIMEGANKLLNSDRGLKFIENIKGAIDKLATGISNVFGWISENEDLVISFLSSIAILVGIKLVGAFATLTITMLANPVTWIVIGLTALIYVLIQAYKNSETFRNKVNDLWSKLQALWDIVKLVTSAFSGNTSSLDTLREKYPQLYEKVRIARQIFLQFKDAVVDLGTKLYEVYKTQLEPIIKKIWEIIQQYIMPAVRDIMSGFEKLIKKGTELWEEHMRPIFEKWGTKIGEVWNNNIKPFVDKFLEGFGKIIQCVGKLWNEFLVPLFNWISETILPKIMPIIETIGNVVITVFGTVFDVLGGLWDILVGLIEFITGVFTGDWEKAWEGIKGIFSGIWGALKGIVEGVLNVIIDIVNSAIRQLNKISVGLPEWDILGDAKGKQFGFNIPEIEHVAFEQGTKGAYNTPDSFIAGENGPELITGAGNKRVYTANDTAGMMGSNETNTYNITINVNGGNNPSETAKSVRQELEDYFASFGRRNPRLREI